MNLVDSSGWIEFFRAGANGPIFKPVIEQRDKLLVPTIGLFEVHKVLSRTLEAGLVDRCLDVMRLGRVLDLTDRRAIAASKASTQHRLALADAAMYSMAQEHGATFWTQDVDYDGLPGVQYFAKPAQTRLG
jgi:predicted nucleic acid-binding protein